ncbi:MAG TPA: hypothetical protein VFY21_00585 [Xanthobacteraceae bacterium]|nr:hypothetical protein [Xanthobacteraceae bacterium]
MRRFLLLAALAALAGGCVVSRTPLNGLGERAAPFGDRTTLAIFERADGKGAWKPSEQKTVTLVVEADRAFRSLDEKGKPEDGNFTFHVLGSDRYLVQARFSADRYGYAVLQVRKGEGLVSPLTCKAIDDDVVKKAGMKMVADDCWLEGTKDPAGFLKSIAAKAPEPTVKYVPVKSK